MGDAPGPASPAAPLLIACALGIEQFALRSGRGGAGDAPGPVTVLRTGMGPRAAEAAVSRARGGGRAAGAPVLAAGVWGG
ncbi:1-hydroxy-2-methyl-2-butenyl 4-diphosphate reductase, partial [Streptomyces sp. NPDC094048]